MDNPAKKLELLSIPLLPPLVVDVLPKKLNPVVEGVLIVGRGCIKLNAVDGVEEFIVLVVVFMFNEANKLLVVGIVVVVLPPRVLFIVDFVPLFVFDGAGEGAKSPNKSILIKNKGIKKERYV